MFHIKSSPAALSLPRIIQRASLTLVICLLPTAYYLLPAASAQSATATVSGVVADEKQAVIAKAAITAVNEATRLTRKTTSNDDGYFTIPLLPPGNYTLTVERDGFASARVPNVVLNVGDQRAMQIQLKVGAVGETVNVTSEAPLINESPAVGTVVDRQFVENLPLNGRSFQSLLLLTPGAVVTPTNYSLQGQFSVNGQRADANYFTVDGVSANNGVAGGFGLAQSAGGSLPGLTSLGGTQSLVSVDAMQEFRIETSTFAPEFGRTPGAQVGIATRSGTNQWHGSLFEYFRNDVLDANDWFGNRNNIRKPRERQNDFGGVLGGPIRKDHTFLFFSYEGLRLRRPQTVTTLVPSNAARALLPASVRPLVNLFPVSSNLDLGNGTAQFSASYSDPSSVDAYSGRVDHSFGTRMMLFGRYSDTPSSSAQRNPFGVLSAVSPSFTRTRVATLGLTSVLTPRISNELRANYSNTRAGSTAVIDNFGGATPQDAAAFFQTLNFPSGLSPQNALFGLNLASPGVSALFGYNSTNEQRQVNFVDNISIVAGAHQLKIGVDYRWLAPFSAPRSYLQFIFFSGVLGGPGSLQSGLAQSVSISAPFSSALLVKNFSLFAQDIWKATPRLTLTYGLRWDVNPPFKSKDPNNPVFTVLNIDNPAALALAPAGTPAYKTTWGNVAPRLGAAYTLRKQAGWETVLRGGFGLFYDVGNSYLAGVASLGWPFTSTRNLANVAVPLTSAQTAPAPRSTTPPVNSNLDVAVPNFQLPRTQQFNAAVEQSLGGAQSVTLSYVGAIGREMTYAYSYFAPNPNFTSFVTIHSNRGASDYHALQAKFQRRLSRGLQALASYTWSHSLDTGSSSITGNPPLVAGDVNIDRGDSDFDIRHSFSAAVVYEVPKPKPGWARAIFSGWSLNDFIVARSAPPVNARATSVFAGGVFFTPRPNVVPGQPFYLFDSQYPGGKAFNRAAFANPTPAGTQGNLRRNALRGFGAWQMDFSVRRQFRLTEKVGLQLITEFFNVLNHPNFGQPVNSIASGLFGQSTSTLATSLGSGGLTGGFSPLYQIGGPRSIQLAAKITF